MDDLKNSKIYSSPNPHDSKQGERSIGDKIKYYRTRAGLSQLELEMEIDASPGCISRIERGKVNPSRITISKIVNALNLDIYSKLYLYDINNYKDQSILSISKKLHKISSFNELIDISLNSILEILDLQSGFITLVKDEKLYAYKTSNTNVSKLAKQIIPQQFSSLYVSIKDINNLMVKCVNEDRVIISDDIQKFILPAIPRKIASIIKNITKTKSLIAIPIRFNKKRIGAVCFGSQHPNEFANKFKITALEDFTDHVAIAISRI